MGDNLTKDFSIYFFVYNTFCNTQGCNGYIVRMLIEYAPKSKCVTRTNTHDNDVAIYADTQVTALQCYI